MVYSQNMQNIFIILLVFINLSVNLTAGSNFHESQESCFVSRELEEECAAVCYPTVKPLLKYMAVCHQKDQQINGMQSQLQDQNEEVVKCKNLVKILNKQLVDERSSSGLKHDLKETIDKVQNLRQELSGELEKLHGKKDNTADPLREEIKKLTSQLASKESVINDINSKLIQKEITMKEKDKILAEKDEYIRQMWKKYFPRSCKTFETGANFLALYVPEAEPFSVICHSTIPGSGWAIVLRELEGSDSLAQKLQKYKEKGFGDLHESFFIGRKNLYLMTRETPHEVHATLILRNGSSKIVKANNLDIGDETEDYVIKTFNRTMSGLSKEQAATSASLSALIKQKLLPFDDLGDWRKLTVMIREIV